jgi:adenylate kinase
LIEEHYRIPCISTGDLLREEVAADTALGRYAGSFMEKGDLVPDEAIVEMVRKRIEGPLCRNGYLLDGFPRTLAQAQALEEMLRRHGVEIDLALNLELEEEELVRRLTGRRTCQRCGAIFHVLFHPPQSEGVCDLCGGALVQREDDREEAIRRRLGHYREETAPVIDYYRKQGKLKDISASGSIGEVERKIDRIIRKMLQVP